MEVVIQKETQGSLLDIFYCLIHYQKILLTTEKLFLTNYILIVTRMYGLKFLT